MTIGNKDLQGKRIGIDFYGNRRILYAMVSNSNLNYENIYCHNVKLEEPVVYDGELFYHVSVNADQVVEVI